MGKQKCLRSICAVLLAVCCAFSLAVSVFAASDGMYEYEVVDGGAVITAYLGAGNAVVTLPSSLGGYPVIGVGDEAFGEVKNHVKPHAEVRQILFPSGITEFGDRAFAGTSWIDDPASADADGFLTVNGVLIRYLGENTSVSVPSSVKSLAIGAFEQNETIREVSLPESITELPAYAFYKCTALRKISLSGVLRNIGQSAFYGCTSLQGVYDPSGLFPDTLVTIADNAFYQCSSLSGTLSLGSEMASLGTYAFAGCTAMTGIELPDTLYSIGSYAIGFSLEYRSGSYYPIQNKEFVIHVTHEKADSEEAEQRVLASYNKTANPIYRYANDPDGTGYFDAFTLQWARLDYPFQMGDVNNDGKVTTADARLVLRCAVSLDDLVYDDDRRAADFDGDGEIRSADARSILRQAVGLSD